MKAADARVAVVLPAAGEGRRMGGKKKQYRLLGDAPVLIQTLRIFERLPYVRQLVVAVPQADRAHWQRACEKAGLPGLVHVVPGGTARQASVYAGLKVVSEAVDVTLIHDAVRPFVRPQEVTAVVEGVLAKGAAALAVPVADTLRRGTGNRFGETVDREGIYAMQTPQGFRRELILEAHRQASGGAVAATDDVELVRRLGHPVRIISGSARNFKVTTPEDWTLARLLWNERDEI